MGGLSAPWCAGNMSLIAEIYRNSWRLVFFSGITLPIVLDFLGFSRSESETYQWVTRHKVGKYLSLAFPLTSGGPGTGACGRGHAEAQDCSWAKLTLVSDFLQ